MVADSGRTHSAPQINLRAHGRVGSGRRGDQKGLFSSYHLALLPELNWLSYHPMWKAQGRWGSINGR